jgi:ribosomal protein L30/L7E
MFEALKPSRGTVTFQVWTLEILPSSAIYLSALRNTSKHQSSPRGSIRQISNLIKHHEFLCFLEVLSYRIPQHLEHRLVKDFKFTTKALGLAKISTSVFFSAI